jgi:hypothetical protein
MLGLVIIVEIADVILILGLVWSGIGAYLFHTWYTQMKIDARKVMVCPEKPHEWWQDVILEAIKNPAVMEKFSPLIEKFMPQIQQFLTQKKM